MPGELSKDERAVYELVAGRMLEAFSGKCVKDVTTALLSGGSSIIIHEIRPFVKHFSSFCRRFCRQYLRAGL